MHEHPAVSERTEVVVRKASPRTERGLDAPHDEFGDEVGVGFGDATEHGARGTPLVHAGEYGGEEAPPEEPGEMTVAVEWGWGGVGMGRGGYVVCGVGVVSSVGVRREKGVHEARGETQQCDL